MSSLNAFLSPGRGYVRLEGDFTSPVSNSLEAKVWRNVGGVLTPIRDGWPAGLSHSKFVIYDTEQPMDTPLSYRALCPLNIDGGFESSVDAWDLAHNTENSSGGQWGSISRTTDFYYPGSGMAALKGVPTGNVATIVLVSEEFPIAAGTSLTVIGKIMASAVFGGGLGIHIRWYTAAHGFNGTSGAADDLWPSPGEWNTYSQTGTAPASTAFARFGLVISGTPPATLSVFLDEMYASVATSTVDSAQLTFPSAGRGWWKDPLHPATMTQLLIDLQARGCGVDGVALLSVGDKQRPADSSVLEVPDAERGSSIFAKRKAVRSSIGVGTLSQTAGEKVRALHSSGAPLLLQLPANLLERDVYGLYADLANGRISGDMRLPVQVHQASYVDVGAPVGPAEGVLGARYQDLDTFTTFAQASAASRTWIDALQGELSTAT